MQGIIKTHQDTKEQGNAPPYTILLVAETGVGKSSLLELITNPLDGDGPVHYNFDFLDYTTE